MEYAPVVQRPKIQGNCPMGCGATLFVANGGYITCNNAECPDPGVVSDILAENESEHVVTLGATAFTIRHPLRERKEQQLEDCSLHRYIEALDGPPRVPGRYRVRECHSLTAAPWQWEVARKP